MISFRLKEEAALNPYHQGVTLNPYQTQGVARSPYQTEGAALAPRSEVALVTAKATTLHPYQVAGVAPTPYPVPEQRQAATSAAEGSEVPPTRSIGSTGKFWFPPAW